jgi:branched-chain amino acid transport system permease protein
VTGGSDGLPVFALPVLNLAGREFTFYAPNSMYYLVFVTVLAGLVLLWLVVHSPFGLILRALRENKQRVAFIGGTGVFLGPLFGAAIFFGLEQLIIHFTENWMFFLGIVLIPIVLFFPQGVFGTLRNRFFRQG